MTEKRSSPHEDKNCRINWRYARSWPVVLGILAWSCTGTQHTTGPAPPSGAIPDTVGVQPSSPTPAPTDASPTFLVLTDTIGHDPEMAALVDTFRARMETQINEVIGEASGILVKSWPEGSLGNFAADAVLRAARARIPDPVDLALVNNGGLRIPVPEGPITVGRMFELMPFENMVSVLVLTGRQIEALAQEIAARGGEPVAGFSFHILTDGDGMVATDLRVGGRALDPNRLYRLATSDYLANGGDEITTLANPVEREDLPLLVRDALIEYVREMGIIRPIKEGRVTGDVRR